MAALFAETRYLRVGDDPGKAIRPCCVAGFGMKVPRGGASRTSTSFH
jgi:hypothetical protein